MSGEERDEMVDREVEAILSSAEYRPAEIRDFFAALNILRHHGYELVEPPSGRSSQSETKP